ncbi:glycoside hydrolase family 63 protein [Metarhizium robertsii ARSEF 23]|uniref:Mannosyl-oligosaccharide glucosidase n=1 Tax=Metarhizium robertsii (strain ARSEF 23 / ATCC MYA-3075) TaxID=655844 RepID=E9EL08_METRA|nr:glycoside hydrolase family 63 protein [Metarhizium robertsii ARSEF 23]EFZ04399.1 glycoside hydrolase family 63 protein [Metarhizium robertsii ARSEF 23]
MARLIQSLAAVAAILATGTSATGDLSVLTGEIGRQNNESLFWGPYKPNLYFGVRPRLPQSLWTGLMWGRIEEYNDVKDGLRYTCEQGEDIHGYGWDEYDARSGGIQTIHDKGNKIDITTSFSKIPGGSNGGSWAVRIKGKLHEDAPADHKTVVYYYIAQEGKGELAAQGEGDELGYKGDATFIGNSEALGDYKIVVTEGSGKYPAGDHEISASRPGDVTLVHSAEVSEDAIWQAVPLLFQKLQPAALAVQEEYGMENPPPAWQVYRMAHQPGKGNSHILQRTYEGSFEFDVIFSSASAGKELTKEDVTNTIAATSSAFADRFSTIFELKTPFDGEQYQQFGKSMFSNLLGGVGYFHGKQVIDRSYAPEYEEENEGFWEETRQARERQAQALEGPYELFTSVPSRPFFPRGFLWDEGFHLVPIADWDMDLTLEVIKSWYNTMDEDGWIPREQILGPEARTKVPEEFQVQYPHYANPPTLFLVIEDFMERLRKTNGTQPLGKEKLAQERKNPLHTAHLDNMELGEDYLRKMYPLLKRQYDWFRKTQRGDLKGYDREAYSSKEGYRWRGRSESHILTSGLDDYPRPQPPHPGELHVDLMSWVGLMTKSLKNIAEALDMKEDVAELAKTLDAIEHNLNDLHWSEKDGCFCDATIDEFEEHQLVCHKGYVSLFPFMVGLLKPNDPKLGKILDLVADEEQLWSPHGIRSLSKQDEFYGTGENYWRSPIWMPMNYMVVKQLQSVAKQEGPYRSKARDMYNRLRKNLVDTVYKSWKETGFAWEQYNPETGAGQRTQHFTGWTSLVVKIMAMDDLSEHGRDEL